MLMDWNAEGRRGIGRPREQRLEKMRRSMTNSGLTEEDAKDELWTTLSSYIL